MYEFDFCRMHLFVAVKPVNSAHARHIDGGAHWDFVQHAWAVAGPGEAWLAVSS